MNQPKIRIWSVFLLLAILSACNDEDPTPSQRITNEKNAYINNWIRERMEFWYLWNNELPASSDINQEPDAFFESLLSDDDRFSWIQEDYQELLNSLKGINKEAGYEFVLYRESEGAQNLIAQVLYVKEGSPAAQAGLLRGDAISHVNNVQLTINNYRDQIAAMQETHTVRYKTPDPVARTFQRKRLRRWQPLSLRKTQTTFTKS